MRRAFVAWMRRALRGEFLVREICGMLIAGTLLLATPVSGLAQAAQGDGISPARAIPTGKAPGMTVKLVKDTPEEKVYAIVFVKGDEVLSGLTDFAAKYGVGDAHFTGIGAVSSATTAWLDLEKKMYRPTVTKEQVEVLSLVGDIAAFNGKPVVHMHAVLGRRDGTTVGGHVWELNVNPTVEVFLTANTTPLAKRSDAESGLKLIDPKE
jgi:predicted DNA-binding protein with PD1-like motif